MADVFLGEDYDPEKLRQVEELQVRQHCKQATLYKALERASVLPEEYVEAVNSLFKDTYLACE